MNKNNYILYTALKTFVFCVFLVLPWAVKSQNYISSNSEISIFSSVDLSSSASWETSRLSNPGFFTWLDNAELYEGATDVFHVNGYVKKTGNDGFVFPVGNGIDLRTLQMSAPSSISSEYAVAWISGNPTSTPDPTNNNELHSTLAFSGVITAVSPIGQWDWLAINDTGEGLIITVSIPALTGDFFTNSADVRLIGWNGTSWVNLGTTGASGLTENSTLSGTMTIAQNASKDFRDVLAARYPALRPTLAGDCDDERFCNATLAAATTGRSVGTALTGAGVGVLLGGLVFGWLRSRNRFFGHVPDAALWVFDSLGLTGFLIVSIMLSLLVFIGEAVRDALDPRKTFA